MAESRSSIPERITIEAATGGIARQQFNSEILILEGNDTLTQDFSLALSSSLAAFADDHRVDVYYIANIDIDVFDITIFGKKLTKAQAAEGLVHITAIFNTVGGVHDVFVHDQLDGDRQADTMLDLDSAQTISPLEKNNHIIVLDPANVTANRVFDVITDPTCKNHWKFLILGGEVDAGFTWQLESGAVPLVTLSEGNIQPMIIDLTWSDAGYKVTRTFLDVNGGVTDNFGRFVQYAKVTHDASVDGAQATYTKDWKLPDGAIIIPELCTFDNETLWTSAGVPIIEWGITNGAIDAILGALAFNVAPYDGANKVLKGDGAMFKITAAESPTITITIADATGGVAHAYIAYIVNKY